MPEITAAITGPDAPIALTTAPGSSAYTMHRDGEILEHLGVVELEHGARNNRVRALPPA